MNKLITVIDIVRSTASNLRAVSVTALVGSVLVSGALLFFASLVSSADATVTYLLLAMAYAIIPTGVYIAVMVERSAPEANV